MDRSKQQNWVANMLKPGSWLGPYEIVDAIGHGGFSITYAAKDHETRTHVVVKEYLPSGIATRTRNDHVRAKTAAYQKDFNWGMERFLMEAQILARFDHPNISRVLRFFKANSTAYIVLRYEDGHDLLKWCRRLKRTLTQEELQMVIPPILTGLHHVHNSGFLHRDIKPANIFMRHDHVPVLIDFGSARYSLNERTMTVVLSHGYSPLEQYTQELPQGTWTDIYALGASMYHVMTGSIPSKAPERAKAVTKGEDSYQPLEEVCKGKYEPYFLKAVDWALAFNEQDRPQNVKDWYDALMGVEPTKTRSSSDKNLLKSAKDIFLK